MLVAREQMRLATAEERAAHDHVAEDARMTAQDLREDGGRADYDDQAQDQPDGAAAPDPEVPTPPGVDPEEEVPLQPEPPPAPEPAPPALLEALARAMADRPAPAKGSAPYPVLDPVPLAPESLAKPRKIPGSPVAIEPC